jgi:RHS repeat-associated protein
VLSSLTRVDEFGVPKAALPAGAKYAFHGSKQREALTSGGMVAMGVRLYQPQLGRFMQVDPVLGGTASPYEYPSDPQNDADLTGKYGENANPSERKYCSKASPRRKYRCWRATVLADKALKSAEKHFPDSIHNGAGDAFRHCFWSGMMTERWGSKQAKTFTDLHERNPDQPPRERRMDVRNNRKGRQYGRNSKSDGEISRKCYDTAKAGKLSTLE